MAEEQKCMLAFQPHAFYCQVNKSASAAGSFAEATRPWEGKGPCHMDFIKRKVKEVRMC